MSWLGFCGARYAFISADNALVCEVRRKLSPNYLYVRAQRCITSKVTKHMGGVELHLMGYYDTIRAFDLEQVPVMLHVNIHSSK